MKLIDILFVYKYKKLRFSRYDQSMLSDKFNNCNCYFIIIIIIIIFICIFIDVTNSLRTELNLKLLIYQDILQVNFAYLYIQITWKDMFNNMPLLGQKILLK